MKFYLTIMKKHIFFFVIITSLFIACSPEISYKVLSFLFDGVPDPDENEIVAVNDSLSQIDSIATERVIKPQFVLHPPYKERACTNCHDRSTMGKLLKPQPELCYQCHEDFNETYGFLHGPVAGGYCTACHNPHMAKFEKLLLRQGKQLCLHCHNSARILKNEFHIDLKDTNCIRCHNPHGGENRYMPQPGLCYQCHEDFNETYNFLHGPVAGEYCTICHSPHSSKSEKLISRSGQQVCLYCHNPKQVFSSEPHEDIENTNCTECHNPHGSPDMPGLMDLNKPYIEPINGVKRVQATEPGHGTCSLKCHGVKHNGQNF